MNSLETLMSSLSELQKVLDSESKKAYVRYIDIMEEDCLGTEFKLLTNKFSQENLESYKEASENLGKHIAYDEANKLLTKLLWENNNA